MGAAFVIKRNDDPVYSVLNSTLHGRERRRDNRFPKGLRLLNCDGAAFVSRRLNVYVAGLHIRIRVVLLSEDDYMLFHACLCNPLPDERFVTAVADEVPSGWDAGIYDALADAGDIIEVFRFGKAADRKQSDYIVFPRHFGIDDKCVGLVLNVLCVNDIGDNLNFLSKRRKTLDERFGDAFRYSRDVVIVAPNGEFNVGVNINLCIIRMDPAGLFSCVDLIQNDVVWSQETDSEIVFFVRIDRR